MVTLSQITRFSRKKKFKKNRKPDLKKCPQKKGHVLKIVIKTPKKPNSARRKTMRVLLTSTRKRVYCYIPGIGHSLQQHKTILVRGGRRRDIPGMKYTGIRGKWDFIYPVGRRTARSKYGIKRF
jgi:ribosomal protein S12, bacterial/organelle